MHGSQQSVFLYVIFVHKILLIFCGQKISFEVFCFCLSIEEFWCSMVRDFYVKTLSCLPVEEFSRPMVRRLHLKSTILSAHERVFVSYGKTFAFEAYYLVCLWRSFRVLW